MNSDFLFSDDFIDSSKKNFDTILFESTFSEKEQSFLGAIAHHTRQEQKLLIVVSQTPVDTIFPLIQLGKAITTIINPSCGMTGFSNKGYWDKRDISKARDFGLNVYEAIYQEQISEFFTEQKKSCYIRINEHTPWKIQLPNVVKNQTIVSFKEYGYSGDNGTILCFGSLLVDVLYGSGFLQEKGQAMDVFASDNLFFNIDKELKESLEKTQRLVLIIDQRLGSLYEYRLKANLCEAGLQKVKIMFLTPYYEKISSVSLDYMYEQAQIDGFGISNRI